MPQTNGPGKYDPQLSAALRDAGALEGLLIVFDGQLGFGFAAQLKEPNLGRVPEILRIVATQIEDQHKGAHN